MDKKTSATVTVTPATSPRAIGQRLVQVRGKVSQEVFATHMGVHVNTWARYERGERLPGTAVYLQLVSQGVDLHWLLTGVRS